MSIKAEIRKLLKLGDVEYMAQCSEFKAECVSRGIPIEKVRHLIRVCIHEDSKPEAMPEPEAPQPPEPPKAVQDKRTDKELSKRTRQSYEQEEGMTPSGTKKSGAAGGRTIFDFIDEKKG
jgi:hypothetical protein